jgi:cationic peptide transport system permease protein
MSRYLLRQLSLLVVTLFLLTILSFSLGYWFPGNALTNLSGVQHIDSELYQRVLDERAFDANIVTQYFTYLSHLLQGDWGISLQDGTPVWEEVKIRFPATMELAILAAVIAAAVGIPMGVISALNLGRWPDRLIMSLSLSAYSIPVFWLAQLLILWFAVNWGWLPIAGQINPLFDLEYRTGSILLDISLAEPGERRAMFADAWRHMVLPVAVLAVMPATLLARLTRAAMHDVIRRNYIKSARAKGLSGRQVVFKHAVPNTMQTVSRDLGVIFSFLITNTMITEIIFSWPGLGNWLVRSIYERDYPVMQAGLLTLAALILFVNVCINLLHAWRYPQVRQDLYVKH